MWLAGQWWWARILGVGDIDNMWVAGRDGGLNIV